MILWYAQLSANNAKNVIFFLKKKNIAEFLAIRINREKLWIMLSSGEFKTNKKYLHGSRRMNKFVMQGAN